MLCIIQIIYTKPDGNMRNILFLFSFSVCSISKDCFRFSSQLVFLIIHAVTSGLCYLNINTGRFIHVNKWPVLLFFLWELHHKPLSNFGTFLLFHASEKYLCVWVKNYKQFGPVKSSYCQTPCFHLRPICITTHKDWAVGNMNTGKTLILLL